MLLTMSYQMIRKESTRLATTLDYVIIDDFYVLFTSKPPVEIICRISMCRDEITLRAQIEAEQGVEGLPPKSEELLLLEDFLATFVNPPQ